MTTYYKVLSPARVAPYSGWRWPRRWHWTPLISGRLERCSVGYHVCLLNYLHRWLPFRNKRVHSAGLSLREPFVVWKVETRGRARHWGDKVGFQQVRLVEVVAACDTKPQYRAFLKRLHYALRKGQELQAQTGDPA